jgi:hypothetical protein
MIKHLKQRKDEIIATYQETFKRHFETARVFII